MAKILPIEHQRSLHQRCDWKKDYLLEIRAQDYAVYILTMSHMMQKAQEKKLKSGSAPPTPFAARRKQRQSFPVWLLLKPNHPCVPQKAAPARTALSRNDNNDEGEWVSGDTQDICMTSLKPGGTLKNPK